MTITEAQAPTSTEEPSTTSVTDTPEGSPTGTPTVTPTATATIPTNAPDCTNLARFVADATIPDNSPVDAGTTFTKTWTIQNLGTCIWGPGYTLAYYSEERLGAPDSIPMPVTYPGQIADISIALAAPTNLGTHRANFVIKNPTGLIMRIDEDSRLWVIINVIQPLVPSATTTPTIGTASAGLVSTTGTAAGSPAPTGSGTSAACAFTTEAAKIAETINAINAYRAQNAIGPYAVNELLTRAAQAHANDMACNKLFGHTGSNGSTPQRRVASTGYVASSVSENVYGSYPPLTGQGVVTWWANDQTDTNHNQNLLSTKFTEIGVGYAFYNNFGYYVVVFASP
jgi:uncharacterized protein YkwD